MTWAVQASQVLQDSFRSRSLRELRRLKRAQIMGPFHKRKTRKLLQMQCLKSSWPPKANSRLQQIGTWNSRLSGAYLVLLVGRGECMRAVSGSASKKFYLFPWFGVGGRACSNLLASSDYAAC